ncbi:hypothetical protein [Sphingomonas sp. 3-13AW]|uniref:hypothetical protein n=1 Tax=Sphingomonas sp. 3-13AW TaxID=3050450 RepID=UPI003BB51644
MNMVSSFGTSYFPFGITTDPYSSSICSATGAGTFFFWSSVAHGAESGRDCSAHVIAEHAGHAVELVDEAPGRGYPQTESNEPHVAIDHAMNLTPLGSLVNLLVTS